MSETNDGGAGVAGTAPAAPRDLRCEHFADPIGVDADPPALSWKLGDDRPGARQTAYQVVVTAADGDGVWDSGRVESGDSVCVPYSGPPLASATRVSWRVRAWDGGGVASGYSEPATWETGLLDAADWEPSAWVGSPALVGGPKSGAASPMLRRAFDLDGGKRVASARLYVTALGVYEAFVNGVRVGDHVLAPGWTDYRRRVHYQTFDVTPHLRPGGNAVGAVLGDGWYCGYTGNVPRRQVYGDRPLLRAKLVVTYADGSTATVATDGSWRTAAGPILSSDLFQGEHYDARREVAGWCGGAFDDSGWLPVLTVADPHPGLVIEASPAPPVRAVETIAAVGEPTSLGGGRWVFDFGQNLAGRVRLRLQGKAGQTVTLRHAEMLNADGTLYTENLRSAAATDHYTFRGEAGPGLGGGQRHGPGEASEEYEPHFTFHGFRYAELSGAGDRPPADALTAVVLQSDTPMTGRFECSDESVNTLWRNIVWGQRGNFLDVPTDCPQRDERLGWTGDAQVFIPTAAYNADVAGFFAKWQRDLADAQLASGAVPSVAPVGAMSGPDSRDGGPAWSDALVICPWVNYVHSGDAGPLAEHFESMRRFVDFLAEQSGEPLVRADPRRLDWCGFGDWLAVDAVTPGQAPTPRELIGTAYFARVAGLLSRVAAVVGRSGDAERYAGLRERVAAAFRREFVTPGGRVVGHTQTGYLLALGFDLLDERDRPGAVDHLVALIAQRGDHLSTGFVGTPLLLPTLARFGRHDVAYRLLTRRSYPSWLYTVDQGATTMWERWNSFTLDRGFGDAGMNSFNHYAYGAAGEFLYATVAGLAPDPDRPGFRHSVVRPVPGGGVTRASASLGTPYGTLASAWALDGGDFSLDLAVPPNATATVHLPDGSPPRDVAAGRHEFRAAMPANAG